MSSSLSLAAALLLISTTCFAKQSASYEITNTSVRRTVCNVKFDKIAGLVVKVKRISRSTLVSRVNIERYEACPYNVSIEYAGRALRLGFLNSSNGAPQNINAVDNFDSTVYAGHFVYDGQRWRPMAEGVIDDEATSIKVHRGKRSIDVRGPVHEQELGTGKTYFCYGVSIINQAGIAVTGICSARREDITPWQNLFESKAVIRSVE